MRISSTLKREMYDGVTLGYRAPEWIDWEQAELDRWPHSMVKEYRDCLPDEEHHWESVLLNYFCTWTDFVEERGGTIDFVEFMMKWFTTEDILYYQIAFDSDGGYMLSYYNEARKTRTKIKAGKWFQMHYNRYAKLMVQFVEEWKQMVMKCQDIYSQYSVDVLSQSVAITHRYRSFHRSDLNSCCSYPASQFSTGGEHPCMVYGGDSGVTLAVIKDSEGKDFARTLLYDGKYIRVYPSGRSHEHAITKGVLQHNNLATGQGCLEFAELNYLPHRDPDMGDFVVCPYLDGEASIVSVSERENGDPCLLVSSEGYGVRGIDTQSGNMHERACFDSRTMCINGDHWDYYCDRCEDGFNQDSDYAIMPEQGGHYCSEDCCSESGNVMTNVGSGMYDWCSEYDVTYDPNSGNYYTDRGLQDSGLVLTHHGDVAKMDDCVCTQSQGWLLSIDCLFVNTPQEYQETPDNLRPVWMLADGSGEVGTETLETFLSDTGQHRSLVEQHIGES